MDIKEYAKKVKELRTAQQQYFNSRRLNLPSVAQDWLKKAKRAEAEVDKLTDAILAGSVQGNLI